MKKMFPLNRKSKLRNPYVGNVGGNNNNEIKFHNKYICAVEI